MTENHLSFTWLTGKNPNNCPACRIPYRPVKPIAGSLIRVCRSCQIDKDVRRRGDSLQMWETWASFLEVTP